ncbi:MAG: twitching motility protein [Acidobacteria bacterium]|nr:MAG: twitching motility protein [Acidobacteriota bacterium]
MNPYDLAPLIRRVMKVAKGASDIIFSPGCAPKMVLDGQLKTVPVRDLNPLSPYQTEMMALNLLAGKRQAFQTFKETGSADLAYALEKCGRFRINIFTQRGSVALVMRIIPTEIPTVEWLGLPEITKKIIHEPNGIVLLTGPTGCGKSSTMAALIDMMSKHYAYHIVTIEDPIEFLFDKNASIIHQRELGYDTPTFPSALRTALRQAPQVIMVGEMRDKESIEIALEAAETGHLILSTLHTIDAAKTIERIIGVFPRAQEEFIRMRFSQMFKYILSQRLLPRASGRGRVLAMEVLASNERTRTYILEGAKKSGSLEDAMKDGAIDGMQNFDMEILRLFHSGTITKETALKHATNPNNLLLKIGTLKMQSKNTPSSSREIVDHALDDLRVLDLDQ